MVNPTSMLAVAATLAPIATGPEQEMQATRLGSLRMAQLESPGFELARAGRSFVGGVSLIAGGGVAVVDLPTTTAPFVLYNSYPAGGRVFSVKRISTFYCSATGGAAGFTLFAGVTPNILATPLTANDATNYRTQAKRGYGTTGGFVGIGKTIPAGTAAPPGRSWAE